MKEQSPSIPIAPVARVTLRLEEAATALGISERFLADLIARGDGPPSFHCGRVRLFSVAKLGEWAESRTAASDD